MRAKNVLIVGPPRSGTSMTARVFANLGYFVALTDDELRPEDRYNRSGYWESERLVEANVQVLRAAGFPHHNTWLYERLPSAIASRIGDVEPLQAHRDLVASYEARGPWLWKDPRLCFTLPYWWPLLPQDRTGVLLVTRNTEHVFQSFVRLSWRDNTVADRAETIARIESHIDAAERAVRELRIPNVAVTYTELEQDPGSVALRLNEAFGVDLCAADIGFVSRRDHNHDRMRGRFVGRLERTLATLSHVISGR